MSNLYFFWPLPWAKLRTTWFKYLVLALPATLLVAAVAALNTFSSSISHVVDHKILPIIVKYESLVVVNDSLGEQPPSFFSGVKKHDYKYFKPAEVSDIASVDQVQRVDSTYNATGLSAVAPNILPNQQVIINHFSGIEDQLASYLGATDFNYRPGATIPVILGTQALQALRVDLQQPEQSPQAEQFLDRYPRSSTVLETVKDAGVLRGLIGQEFDLELGRLQWQPLLYRQAAELENTYAFIPSDTRQKLLQQYRQTINRYWDVDQLMQPLTVKVKVVAVDFAVTPNALSLPKAAIVDLHQQLRNRLDQAAQGKPTPPASSLGQSFQGLNLADGYLTQSADYYSHLVLPDGSQALPPIFIPGLYYQSGSQLTATQLKQLTLPIDQVVASVDHISHKADVHNHLFKGLGYEQGLSSQSIYYKAQSIIDSARNIFEFFAPIFLIVTVIATFFITLRIVRSSYTELAIIRLVGATRGQALTMFVGFFTQQLLAAIIIGLLLGYLLVILGAPLFINALLQNNSLGFDDILAIYGQHLTLSPTDFIWIDLPQILSDSIWLIIICLAGLLVASLLAARIQPSTLVRQNQE